MGTGTRIRVFLTSLPAHATSVHTAKHATDQSAIYTRLRRASIYAGMSAYGFINMQPSTKRMGTIYRTDSLLTIPAFPPTLRSIHTSVYLFPSLLIFLHSFPAFLLGWLLRFPRIPFHEPNHPALCRILTSPRVRE